MNPLGNTYIFPQFDIESGSYVNSPYPLKKSDTEKKYSYVRRLESIPEEQEETKPTPLRGEKIKEWPNIDFGD